jgi:hypothetical protein
MSTCAEPHPAAGVAGVVPWGDVSGCGTGESGELSGTVVAGTPGSVVAVFVAGTGAAVTELGVADDGLGVLVRGPGAAVVVQAAVASNATPTATLAKIVVLLVM